MKHMSDLGLEDSGRRHRRLAEKAEEVSLGEKLYFDERPSTDRTVSFGDCHGPATAADRNMVGVGIELKKGARNAPTVLNSMFTERSVYNVSAQGGADGIRQPLKILSG